MASRKTFLRSSNALRAFTMIEIVTVIGIFTVLAGMTLILGIDGYRGFSFHSDRDILVAALERARAEAMGNVCLGTACTDGKPHGVALVGNQYIIFQGENYAIRDSAVDEFLDAAPSEVRGGTVSEIIFGQLSGTSSSPAHIPEPWTITLTDPSGRTSTVTIEGEGQVAWTN